MGFHGVHWFEVFGFAEVVLVHASSAFLDWWLALVVVPYADVASRVAHDQLCGIFGDFQGRDRNRGQIVLLKAPAVEGDCL